MISQTLLFEDDSIIVGPYNKDDLDELSLAFTLQIRVGGQRPIKERELEYLKSLPDNAWVIRHKLDNRIVGAVWLRYESNYKDDAGAMGISLFLKNKYERKGIATRAVNSVINHAFSNTIEPKIRAVIHRGNEPSIKLFEKLGFKYISPEVASLFDIYEFSKPN